MVLSALLFGNTGIVISFRFELLPPGKHAKMYKKDTFFLRLRNFTGILFGDFTLSQ